MRGTGRRTGRLLAQQAERELEVELRVLVVLVVGQRAAERPGRVEQEAEPLAREVVALAEEAASRAQGLAASRGKKT